LLKKIQMVTLLGQIHQWLRQKSLSTRFRNRKENDSKIYARL
jgi:hypothetical protein